MSTYLGTLTATATAPADVRAQLRTQITAHPAWSLVESTTMGSSQNLPTDVYRCDPAASGLPSEFFIAVMLGTPPNLAFGIAEGYNTTTHLPQRPAMYANGTTTLASDGGLLSTSTEVDWYNGYLGAVAAGALGQPFPLPVAATDDYLIAVHADAITVAVRAAKTVIQLGAYDSEVPDAATTDPMPLHLSSQRAGFAMRRPMCGGLSVRYGTNLNGAANDREDYGGMYAGLPVDVMRSRLIGQVGSADVEDYDRYTDTPGVKTARVPVLNSYSNSLVGSRRREAGWMRGHYKYVRVSRLSGCSVLDTVVIDGVQHTLVHVDGEYGLWLETPA